MPRMSRSRRFAEERSLPPGGTELFLADARATIEEAFWAEGENPPEMSDADLAAALEVLLSSVNRTERASGAPTPV
jgi:hypothetical protein